MKETNPYRLPRSVVPSRYDLELRPDLASATFDGTVGITCNVTDPVAEVVLNAVDLDIGSAVLVGVGEQIACDTAPDGERERLTLTPSGGGLIAAGEWRLQLGFTGVLNDKLRGFYRSTFRGEGPDGSAEPEEHVIATTQMEATDARRAFPCFDEPDFKAVFSVTLVVEDGLVAISNGREIARSTREDGRVAVGFADTIPMSTYLVAFVVGPLVIGDERDVDGVPVRVVHRPGQEHLTGFALDAAAASLRWFVDYYGIPYPGDKLDLVALPDFGAGAMENLGCVTFREVLLLVDPDKATGAELAHVALVVAHEIAHMWFGDLVTMRWWNGIWLNEAFATFMEVSAVDAWRPDWRRWDRFGLERAVALDVDALTETRPVEYPVVSPSDAEGMFDVLTYEKGGSVLRQLEQYLGPDSFRDGVRAYLREHQQGNTETGDLWDSIEDATGHPVRRIMESWIFQPGHPVVEVEREGSELRLSQRRFRYSPFRSGDPGYGGAPETEEPVWSVPVMGRSGGATSADDWRLLLDADAVVVDVEGADWVVVNAGAHGFYRVHYAADLRDALVERMHDVLSPLERHSLVDDTWATVLTGDLPASDFVSLARGLAPEDDLGVWQTALGALDTLARVVPVGDRESFAATIGDITGPAVARLGWGPDAAEGDLDRELRGVLLRAAGVLAEDQDVRARARSIHDAGRASPASVEANVLAAAAAIVADSGGNRDYDVFLDLHRNATTPQEEMRYLLLLTTFPDGSLLDRTLAMTLRATDDGSIRSQNAAQVLSAALAHREHGPRAWDFVRANWGSLMDRLPSFGVVRMLSGARSLGFTDAAGGVLEFFESHDVPQGEKTLAQYLERLRVNRALLERERSRLGVALRDGWTRRDGMG